MPEIAESVISKEEDDGDNEYYGSIAFDNQKRPAKSPFTSNSVKLPAINNRQRMATPLQELDYEEADLTSEIIKEGHFAHKYQKDD